MSTRGELAPAHLPAAPSEASGRDLLTELRQRWERGEPVRAEELLTGPADKSLVLDLAYEEYCLRQEAGESPDPDEFCRRFPNYHTSLHRLLEAHQLLAENPQLLSATRAERWPAPGDTFAGFALVGELGRGAFGRVYLATEPDVGNRRVAVKVSPYAGSEAEVLGRLEHPNIVPIHSCRRDPASGLTAVCMPYRGHTTLCDLLDRAFTGPRPPTSARVIAETLHASALPEDADADDLPLPRPLRRGRYIDGVLYLGIQIAEGLAFAHAQGICHRDLKPSNVLLSRDGRAMLLDFDLSSDDRREANRVGGTIPYMAPEQLRALDDDPDGSAPADVRSDLFALGVVLYQLLSGEHPFGLLPRKASARELRDLLRERHSRGPAPLRTANQQVDRPLARLVERCLASDPDDRPQSAAELAAALRRCAGWAGRARRRLRQHPRRAGGVLVLLLITTLAAGAWFVQRDPYPMRCLNDGWEAYRRGAYRDAVAAFTRAAEADPRLAQAYYARGRAYQQLGQFASALDDYQRADRLAPDGRTAACIGYCLNRTGHHRLAIEEYQRAINAGYCEAEVFNNQGFSYLQSNEPRKARPVLDQAIERNPSLQAAYFNRALVELNSPPALSRPPPKDALADIRRALDLGPGTADMYHTAARLCAIAIHVDNDPAWREAALHYARQAADYGLPPKLLASDNLFRPLSNDPQFQELVTRAPPTKTPPQAPRLLDPVRDTGR
jgi:serine/threonine protein kinase/Tfp pilus assembly protein PilF